MRTPRKQITVAVTDSTCPVDNVYMLDLTGDIEDTHYVTLDFSRARGTWQWRVNTAAWQPINTTATFAFLPDDTDQYELRVTNIAATKQDAESLQIKDNQFSIPYTVIAAYAPAWANIESEIQATIGDIGVLTANMSGYGHDPLCGEPCGAMVAYGSVSLPNACMALLSEVTVRWRYYCKCGFNCKPTNTTFETTANWMDESYDNKGLYDVLHYAVRKMRSEGTRKLEATGAVGDYSCGALCTTTIRPETVTYTMTDGSSKTETVPTTFVRNLEWHTTTPAPLSPQYPKELTNYSGYVILNNPPWGTNILGIGEQKTYESECEAQYACQQEGCSYRCNPCAAYIYQSGQLLTLSGYKRTFGPVSGVETLVTVITFNPSTGTANQDPRYSEAFLKATIDKTQEISFTHTTPFTNGGSITATLTATVRVAKVCGSWDIYIYALTSSIEWNAVVAFNFGTGGAGSGTIVKILDVPQLGDNGRVEAVVVSNWTSDSSEGPCTSVSAQFPEINIRVVAQG